MKLDYDELLKETHVSFSRSGGKGGQNVNKVETKVELYLNIPESKLLTEHAKAVLLATLPVDKEGTFKISSSSERYQYANRKKAEQRLISAIRTALQPQRARIETSPSPTSKIARLYTKRRQGTKKKERKKVSSHED